MAIGFNSGSKAFDNYLEAYYEVIKCFYEGLGSATIEENVIYDYSSLYDTLVVPMAEALADTIEGELSSKELNDYYESLYTKDYFVENNSSIIWDGYDVANCDILTIVGRWGFNNQISQSVDPGSSVLFNGSADGIIVALQKYKKKNAQKFDDFDPITNTLRIDMESFNLGGYPTFAAAKNRKAIKKKFAKQDIDFLYDQKKGGLYFNENGIEKGFGDGGIVAILKGAPDLTESNLEFI